MKKIKLALVGRPNVGKSALFNRLCGYKKAIVDEAEGTTRDRLYGEGELFGKKFEIIDTGGIDTRSETPFREGIRRQAEIAIEEADSIIFVVDSRCGITQLDQDVAKILRASQKPVTLAANKIDDLAKESEIYQFHKLGISKIVAVSATQGFQMVELLEAALEGMELPSSEEVESSLTTKIAIVGRPNVGKSTLLNVLLKEDRSVVSPVPGTTRDAIDATIVVDGKPYTLVDTAGIRRKRGEHEVVDKFAAIRTEKAIEQADICLFMVDAQEGLTAQDKRIAMTIEEKGKGCILLFNKWDLTKGHRMEHCELSLRDEAAFLNHCPKLFISAKEGRNLQKLFSLIEEVRTFQGQRIGTGQLNKFVEKAIQTYHPAMLQGKRLRIYYMAQVETQPPTFILFVNYPKLMQETYKRYLIHQFRESYKFTGNPLRFFLKARKREALTFSGE
jgi:GTP-binding protein